MVFHCFLIFLQKKIPIMPALCLMLHPSYYAQNYAGIMYLILMITHTIKYVARSPKGNKILKLVLNLVYKFSIMG